MAQRMLGATQDHLDDQIKPLDAHQEQLVIDRCMTELMIAGNSAGFVQPYNQNEGVQSLADLLDTNSPEVRALIRLVYISSGGVNQELSEAAMMKDPNFLQVLQQVGQRIFVSDYGDDKHFFIKDANIPEILPENGSMGFLNKLFREEALGDVAA